ncbi:hypothetical protein D1BOALGB6SA_4904 [Olavius sp. associated proteobacterium Delta 1]|nr:hypothetical protein D1BOALGB6SA_4904 [Olavius sp. associated proteobacterium Delta 1]
MTLGLYISFLGFNEIALRVAISIWDVWYWTLGICNYSETFRS